MTHALSLSSQFKTKYVVSPLIKECYYYSQMMMTISPRHLIAFSPRDEWMIFFDKHTLEYSHHFKYSIDDNVLAIHWWNGKLYSVCSESERKYKTLIIFELVEQDNMLINSEPLMSILMNKIPFDQFRCQGKYFWNASSRGVIWYNFKTNKIRLAYFDYDYITNVRMDLEKDGILTITHDSKNATIFDMDCHGDVDVDVKNYKIAKTIRHEVKLSINPNDYHVIENFTNSLNDFKINRDVYDPTTKTLYHSYGRISKTVLAIPKIKSSPCDIVYEITDNEGIIHKFTKNHLSMIPYFEPMLEGRWPDVVHLDYPTQLVKDLLHFLDHDDIPEYNADQLISVIGMANYLMMDRYQKELMDRLYKIVSKDADVYLQVWYLDYDYMFPILADHLLTHLKNYSFDADTIDRMKAEDRFTQMLVAKKPVYEQ